MDIQVETLRKYVTENQEELMTAVKNENMIAAGREKADVQRDRQEKHGRKACMESFSPKLMREEMN